MNAWQKMSIRYQMKKNKKLSSINRFWTNHLSDPFEGVSFVKRESVSPVNGEKKIVLAPKHWSQTAVDIVAQKYCKKFSKDHSKPETDFRDVFSRLAKCWRYWGVKEGLFISSSEAQVFEDEILYMLVHQMAAPNSPQWFNTGVYHSYRYKGAASGHWYYDEVKKQCLQTKSSFERPQPHACFIQSVKDDLVGENGITDLWQREARLFKYGSGTGTNFSTLRAKGEPLKDGGKSSGVMSFLMVGDRNAAAIKSGGTTRRAAKMVILDDDHPDILDFIQWKEQEEKKVAAMVIGNAQLDYVAKVYEKSDFQALTDLIPELERRGLPYALIEKILQYKKNDLPWVELNLTSDWQGPAYETVSGQNSNNSVRLSHQFMRALETGKNWKLINRVDHKTCRLIPAQKLMDALVQAAWSSADPGVQFSGTINEWHTCPEDGEIRASNPCSEYLFLDDTACNLASLNLLSFFNQENEFLQADYQHAIRLWTFVLDISVSMAQFPSKEIAKRSYQYRTLGLGLTNMAAVLMAKGLAYDSDHARSWVQAVCSLLGATAWQTSIELAQRKAPFERFAKNKKHLLNVLEMHTQAASGKWTKQAALKTSPYLLERFPDNKKVFEHAYEIWQQVCLDAKKYGVRNAQTTLIAPTGTISLVMDCETTGIEPEYALVKWKDLSGGGRLDFKNSLVERALISLGVEDEKKRRVLDYMGQHHGFENCPDLSEEQKKVFDCARPSTVGGKRMLHYNAHLLMVAAAQPFLCGAISKTINLNQDISLKEVEDIFLQAYKLMIKAVAIYRDSSKLSQPLNLKEVERAGFLGFSCPFCQQQKLIRTGTCYRCENCGESTSCG